MLGIDNTRKEETQNREKLRDVNEILKYFDEKLRDVYEILKDFDEKLIVRALTSVCLPGKYRKNWGADWEEMVPIIQKTHFLQVESATPGLHACAKPEKWVSCLTILKHDITFSKNINFYITEFPMNFQTTLHAT